jgi:hypothetical protein
VTDTLCADGVVVAAETCIGADADTPNRSVEVPTASIIILIHCLLVARCRRAIDGRW